MKSVSEYMIETGLTHHWYDPFERTWRLRNPLNQYEEQTVPADSLPLVETPYGTMVKWPN